MSKKLILSLVTLLFFVAPLAIAQMRGGGGMGQGGSGMGGMQGGSGQGSGMGGSGMGSRQMGGMDSSQMQTRQQRRQQMHTTNQQDYKYNACRQAMTRVRARLHQMAKITRTQPLDVQQVDQLQDQLNSDIQDMEQQLDDLAASLNDEQKSADQKQLEKVMKETKDLEAWSEALGFELEQEKVDSAKVQEKVRKADTAAKELQKQERDLAVSLGIEP